MTRNEERAFDFLLSLLLLPTCYEERAFDLSLLLSYGIIIIITLFPSNLVKKVYV